LTELWFYVPLDTKLVISEMFPNPISTGLVIFHTNFVWKTKPNTTKARIHQSKDMYYNTQ